MFWSKFEITYSVLYTSGYEEIREKEDDSEHYYKTSPVYLAYQSEFWFMEAGEFLRQVKLNVFLLIPWRRIRPAKGDQSQHA